VRWAIYAAKEKCEAALDIASALIQLAPEHAAGWVGRSSALHGLKRTADARDNLLRVVDQFPACDLGALQFGVLCVSTGPVEGSRGLAGKSIRAGRQEGIKAGCFG